MWDLDTEGLMETEHMTLADVVVLSLIQVDRREPKWDQLIVLDEIA